MCGGGGYRTPVKAPQKTVKYDSFQKLTSFFWTDMTFLLARGGLLVCSLNDGSLRSRFKTLVLECAPLGRSKVVQKILPF